MNAAWCFGYVLLLAFFSSNAFLSIFIDRHWPKSIRNYIVKTPTVVLCPAQGYSVKFVLVEKYKLDLMNDAGGTTGSGGKFKLTWAPIDDIQDFKNVQQFRAFWTTLKNKQKKNLYARHDIVRNNANAA